MKKTSKLFFTILFLSFVYTGFSQDKNDKNQPHEDIKVNKEYDEDGNLTRYDSTYVYTWSSDSSLHCHPDSSFFGHPDMEMIKKRMQEQMHNFFGRDTIHGKYFSHPFHFDHFLGDDFFGSDFFSRPQIDEGFFKEFDNMLEEHMQFRNEHMDEMHQHMGSLRQGFMEKQKDYFRKRDSLYRKQKSK